jgi:hypothetical protein
VTYQEMVEQSARWDAEADAAAERAEAQVTQAVFALCVAAGTYAATYAQEDLMALLRASASLARAQGFVVVEGEPCD